MIRIIHHFVNSKKGVLILGNNGSNGKTQGFSLEKNEVGIERMGPSHDYFSMGTRPGYGRHFWYY